MCAYLQHALSTIKLKLEEINRCLDRLEKTGQRGGKSSVLGRCFGLLAAGHDVLEIETEFDRLDGEIKIELEQLVKATQLHAFSNRSAGVLQSASSRAFWDRHFKDSRSAAAHELSVELAMQRALRQ